MSPRTCPLATCSVYGVLATSPIVLLSPSPVSTQPGIPCHAIFSGWLDFCNVHCCSLCTGERYCPFGGMNFCLKDAEREAINCAMDPRLFCECAHVAIEVYRSHLLGIDDAGIPCELVTEGYSGFFLWGW